jgi:hypothetical protein
MLMGAIVAFMALCSTLNAQQTTTFRPEGSDGVDAVSYERAKLQFIQDNPEYFMGNQAAVVSKAAPAADYDARKMAAQTKSDQQNKARNTAMAEAGLLSVDRNQLNERERSKYDAKQAEIDAQFPKD